MSRAAAGLVVAVATLAPPGPALADGAANGLGPFWDTGLHLLSGPEHLLLFLGLGLWLAQQAAEPAREPALLVLPTALAAGLVLARLDAPTDLLAQALAAAIGAVRVTLNATALAQFARAFWARVGLRVAGSWIAAVAILVLASAR